MDHTKRILSGFRLQLPPDVVQSLDLKVGDFYIARIEEVDNQRTLRIIPAKVLPR